MRVASKQPLTPSRTIQYSQSPSPNFSRLFWNFASFSWSKVETLIPKCNFCPQIHLLPRSPVWGLYSLIFDASFQDFRVSSRPSSRHGELCTVDQNGCSALHRSLSSNLAPISILSPSFSLLRQSLSTSLYSQIPLSEAFILLSSPFLPPSLSVTAAGGGRYRQRIGTSELSVHSGLIRIGIGTEIHRYKPIRSKTFNSTAKTQIEGAIKEVRVSNFPISYQNSTISVWREPE